MVFIRMRTIHDIRELAKKINSTVYISYDMLYRENSGRKMALRGNEVHTFEVPNLDSPDVEEKLNDVLNMF